MYVARLRFSRLTSIASCQLSNEGNNTILHRFNARVTFNRFVFTMNRCIPSMQCCRGIFMFHFDYGTLYFNRLVFRSITISVHASHVINKTRCFILAARFNKPRIRFRSATAVHHPSKANPAVRLRTCL